MIDSGIVDANVFLRHIIEDDPEQAKSSTRLLEQIARREIAGTLLPTVVLEVVFVLQRTYHAPREDVYNALTPILRTSGLNIVDREQLVDALEIYRGRAGISFADAYHCAMARSFHHGAIVSFDQKLSGIEGVARREPGDFATA